MQWQDSATDWSSSLKLHEYVGSGRPILAIGGHDDSAVSRLLAQSGRAQMVHVASECAAVIRKWLAEFRAEGSLRVPDGWEAKARELSGISRGLDDLERALKGDR